MQPARPPPTSPSAASSVGGSGAGRRGKKGTDKDDPSKPLSHSYGFLSRLWEQSRGGVGFGDTTQYNSMTSAPASAGQIPSLHYDAVVKRETAKPSRLSTFVSTDNAPLPTRTVAPSFTEFRRSAFDGVRPSEFNYAHQEALRRKYMRSTAQNLKGYSAMEIDQMHGDAQRGEDGDDGPLPGESGLQAEAYTEPQLRKALQDAHHSSLMEAIRIAKMDARSDPLMRALERREKPAAMDGFLPGFYGSPPSARR